MEFKKCARCGSFFISDNSICCHCEPKDRVDLYKLNSFITEEPVVSSITDLSLRTGVSTTTLNRFIENNAVPGLIINPEK